MYVCVWMKEQQMINSPLHNKQVTCYEYTYVCVCIYMYVYIYIYIIHIYVCVFV